MPSILETGASSEGGVYQRRPSAAGFVRIAGARAASAGGRGGARAVDYIREWRNLRLVRRKVDDEVFRKQKVDFIITPTIREVSWSIEEELGRGGGGRGAIPSPATRVRWMTTVCRPSPFPAAFRKPACPSACRSAARIWREVNVLALAHAYQQATDWHKRKPPLTPDAKVPPLSKAAAAQTGEAVTR